MSFWQIPSRMENTIITYLMSPPKIRVCYVGADEEIFIPSKFTKTDDNFVILFYGTYIPLHGIEYIIKAGKLLESHRDIRFKIVGKGQLYNDIQEQYKRLNCENTSFIDWVEYKDSPKHIANSDICLGIFGDTGKARRVIPTKAFQALAMRKPLITGDSPATREILKDKEDCILCKMGDARSLAKSILVLKDDEVSRRKVAKNGYELFKERFTPKAIGRDLREILKEVLDEQ